ncbi:hypothetical protein CAP48_17965 [Advenella sp. S44]|nr:hypothetical protein CAP48_17965 [Advenella sp. S44]
MNRPAGYCGLAAQDVSAGNEVTVKLVSLYRLWDAFGVTNVQALAQRARAARCHSVIFINVVKFILIDTQHAKIKQ